MYKYNPSQTFSAASTEGRSYGNTRYTLRGEGGDKPRPYGDTGDTAIPAKPQYR